jgi:hypothetical protein
LSQRSIVPVLKSVSVWYFGSARPRFLCWLFAPQKISSSALVQVVPPGSLFHIFVISINTCNLSSPNYQAPHELQSPTVYSPQHCPPSSTIEFPVPYLPQFHHHSHPVFANLHCFKSSTTSPVYICNLHPTFSEIDIKYFFPNFIYLQCVL